MFKEWGEMESGVRWKIVEESGLTEDTKDESAWERERDRESLEVDKG